MKTQIIEQGEKIDTDSNCREKCALSRILSLLVYLIEKEQVEEESFARKAVGG